MVETWYWDFKSKNIRNITTHIHLVNITIFLLTKYFSKIYQLLLIASLFKFCSKAINFKMISRSCSVIKSKMLTFTMCTSVWIHTCTVIAILFITTSRIILTRITFTSTVAWVKIDIFLFSHLVARLYHQKLR